jgi:glycosyltransferase involved in cell wall biosynthesis
MSHYLKISIITPTFNQAQYLEKTILSVIEQNYPNLEYIIIDGGSTDNSVEIIKKYEKHLKYWVSEPDRGQSHAINKGLKHATGDIINWLNSDDYLEPKALNNIYEHFKDNTIDVLCGYANLIRPNSIPTIKQRTSQNTQSLEKTIASGSIMQPATFFRKQVFNEMSPVEESLHFMMDHFLWLKYIGKYGFEKVKYIDDILVNVLVHNQAKSAKLIHLFYYDRMRIYSALNLKMKLNLKSFREESSLQFSDCTFFENHINGSKLDFLLLKESVFKRSEMGNKINIRWIFLFKMCFYYPLSIIHLTQSKNK